MINHFKILFSPQHELKWKAEQKQEAKEKLEAERSEEYKREQERWKTRHLLSSEVSLDQSQLRNINCQPITGGETEDGAKLHV